jgi:transposase
MKITRCKLSKKVQRRLLEFFTAEVTARTAADLLNIQPNTAALTPAVKSVHINLGDFNYAA